MTLTIYEPTLGIDGSVDMELAAICEFTTWVLLGGKTQAVLPCDQEAEFLVKLVCPGCGEKSRLACQEDALAVSTRVSVLACSKCKRTDAFYVSHVPI